MLSYLILNVVFMGLLGLVVYLLKPVKFNYQRLLTLVAILLIMTAIFDSIIIALGLVTYDIDKILGLYIGRAPIEDFAYAIVAAVIVPIIWLKGDTND